MRRESLLGCLLVTLSLALVLACAPREDTTVVTTPAPAAPKPEVEATLDTFKITAHEHHFEPSEIRATPGQNLTITLVNRGTDPHNIEFVMPAGEFALEMNLAPGESGTLYIAAPMDPGSYTFYCPVGNHRELGMEGRLVVD